LGKDAVRRDKGIGTSDALLINFLILGKDSMDEVRGAFKQAYKKELPDWIASECSGDYKKLLVKLSKRNSEEKVEMRPIWWAQRCVDAVYDVEQLKTLLAEVPAVALKRGTEVYEKVYPGSSLAKDLEAKSKENKPFFSFSNYWKVSMQRLVELPLSIRVTGIHDAITGWGTDEFTLTGLICTIPPNMHDDVQKEYKERYEKDLVEAIGAEWINSKYAKLLKLACMSKIDSRCEALHGAMEGWGTDERQLIRVILFSTIRERQLIRRRYEEMYGRDLIGHIEEETNGFTEGHFRIALVAILECDNPDPEPDYNQCIQTLREAMDGIGTDEDAIIRVIASKTPAQVQELRRIANDEFGFDLFERIDSETYDWGTGVFLAPYFRATILGLLREPMECLAHSVRYCIEGWGTDNTGLITCLVHLNDRQRRELRETYRKVFEGRDLIEDIKGEWINGDFKEALCALVLPPPHTYAKCMRSAMKGLGTSDNLLINWLCIAKDRMDEVREAFGEMYEGEDLGRWIESDCSGDYMDTLRKVANRACPRFPGAESGLSIMAPPTQEEAVLRFNKTFNALCKKKKANQGEHLKIPEAQQQELGVAFCYFANQCALAPSLDMPGLWTMTNAIGFPPADDGPDLLATFHEWDSSGTGDICWNDFVVEMTTRVNDPNHYNADLLPEIGELPDDD
jgi:hypothetical protein